MNVLIADDEEDVLIGMKRIINWKALGCKICGEASTGSDALHKILLLDPDLVVLDIRMPGMTGLEIIEKAQNAGFQGHFIILSGYSDFTYAQTAVRLGVDCYLVKPVDEDELTDAVLQIRSHLEDQRRKTQILRQYRENARSTILISLIKGEVRPSEYDLEDLHLIADQYMIVLYEHYNQDSFCDLLSLPDLLRAGGQFPCDLEELRIDTHHIILLKGAASIRRFYRLLEHYSPRPQPGSPLDALFLIYGRPVTYIQELPLSYQDTLELSKRRFFCDETQHILSYQELPNPLLLKDPDTGSLLSPEETAGYIQAHNRTALAESLMDLTQNLYYSRADVLQIKRDLIDFFLQVKQFICTAYPATEIPLPGSSQIIERIMNKCYLYEIIHFFSEQFEICMKAVGYYSGESILESVLDYIDHNYYRNLRLESIAPLFGYTSSYLGKLFKKKFGESFNSYLDSVRIESAKTLLKENQYKVYEISEKVGYKNRDYFHKKFKKYTGTTPAEYRKSLSDADSAEEPDGG